MVTQWDSQSEDPGFKSRGRPAWLRFLEVSSIAKKLFNFKGKCRVGPHIPLLLIQFNVSRDLKTLLSERWTSNAKFPNWWQCKWTHTVAHGWGCLISQLFASDVAPGDYVGHGPIDVSHDRWGCLISWLFTSDVVRRLLWTRPNRCLPWMRKNLMCVIAEVQYINISRPNIPNKKSNSRDKTPQPKRL